jgi:hypothetical protein
MDIGWKSILASSLMFALASTRPAMAGTDCRATSGRQTVAVIELYTSEGCDSCPPADRWLSAIEVPREMAIPLSLHVDYWDRLGWKDRFASAGLTERQYEQKRRQGSAYVYTPQVLLQGRDFRQWGVRGEPAASLAAVNARPPRAHIDLEVERQGDKARVMVQVAVPDARDRGRSQVVVALVQDALVSQVTAGENRGKRLAHDHVVRRWHAQRLAESGGSLREQVAFALPEEIGPLSIVAFVEDVQTGEVLQALALPMCAEK